MKQNAAVVVPLDGSKVAERALSAAIELARILGTTIKVVHSTEGERLKTQAERGHAAEVFGAYVRDLSDRLATTVPVEAVSVGGPAADSILDESEDAAAIVLSTHGRGGARAYVVGSVADKIVRAMRVPALVVPLSAPATPFGGLPILVGLDGGEASERGLAEARELGKLAGCPVELLRSYSLLDPIAFGEFSPELAESLEAAARQYLADAALPGEKVHAVEGVAEIALEQTAESIGAGLIVVTSSGKGLGRRLFLGSTTTRLLHSSHRPLLIIPASG